MFSHDDAKMEISKADYDKIKAIYNKKLGTFINDKILISKKDLEVMKARGFDVNQICIDEFSSTEKEFFKELADFKIQKYFSNPYSCPLKVDFKTMMEKTLKKDATTFDHKGSPVSKKYFMDGIELAKRTWNILYFNVETIMLILQVPQNIAEMMADDLIWMRYEYFHFVLEDGTYSTHTKYFLNDYIEFDENGIPDLEKFYNTRKEERATARKTILTLLEPKIIKFIMDGTSTDLETARGIGITFLKNNNSNFDSYVKSGDETIIDVILNDNSTAFLNYDSSIVGVDCRKYLINSLKQVSDLTQAI
jgi:hypothetical protein